MSRTYPKKPKPPRKPPRLVIVLLAFLLASTLAHAQLADWTAGDQVVRFTYNYGSSELIPGTSETYAVVPPPPPPVIPPPVVCNQKPKKFDCPHAPEGEDSGGGQDTDHGSVGVSWAYFLEDDLSIEFGGWFPTGNAGADSFSATAALNYHFGDWLVPLEIDYVGQLDAMAVGLGGGYDWVWTNGTNLRLKATGDYLLDSDVDERWAWTAQAAVGFAF